METTVLHHQTQQQTLPLLLLIHDPELSKPPILPYLQTRYTVLDPHAHPPDPLYASRSSSARVILCWGLIPLTANELDLYPAVECVICTTAGVSHVDLNTCRRRGIRVTSTGDAFSDDAADYAVGLAVDVLRRISSANRFVRGGSWPASGQFPLGAKVSGKRVGILGLGNIGSRVAKRFEAFGCKIAYNSRNMKSHIPYLYYDNVPDLALNSDILIVCCAFTDKTYHVVNKDVMTAMGKRGIIVNVGRGQLIDEKELVQFLVRGDIGGAGLDVFEHEPRVPEELFTLDNVVLSPHKAVLTPDSFAASRNMAVSNLEAFFSDKPLQAEICFD